jgi:hypothetical protein
MGGVAPVVLVAETGGGELAAPPGTGALPAAGCVAAEPGAPAAETPGVFDASAADAPPSGAGEPPGAEAPRVPVGKEAVDALVEPAVASAPGIGPAPATSGEATPDPAAALVSEMTPGSALTRALAVPPVAAGMAAVAAPLVVAASTATPAPAPAPAAPMPADGLGEASMLESPKPPSSVAPGRPDPCGEVAPAGTKPGVCGDMPDKDGVVISPPAWGSDGAPPSSLAGPAVEVDAA